MSETRWEDVLLTPEHAALLDLAAITPQVAKAVGIYSAAQPSALPEELQHAPVPGIVFPWKSPTGRVEYQVRPDNPTYDENGRPRKYLWRKGMVPILGEVAAPEGAKSVWIVEGTKQSLAAASHAPADVAVYGIAGCRMWMHDNVPIPDLVVVDGLDVVIFLDADAASNPDVYEAGMGLKEALEFEGAESVRFARLPGGKNAGLDDVLAKRSPDRRTAYVVRLAGAAATKPADRKPKGKPQNRQAAPAPVASDHPITNDRPIVVTNDDPHLVINQISHALVERRSGRDLFNYGDAVTRAFGHKLAPVDRDAFHDVIAETVRTVRMGNDGSVTPDWPHQNVIKSVYSRVRMFAPLNRVSRVPFVRPDGSICQTPGYDEETRTLYVPDPELGEIVVPESPTREQVDTALWKLRDDWLGDMPLQEEADRANLMALLLTPFVRGLVPRVPLAVVDGLQMGSGKNLLAECLAILITGSDPDYKPWTIDEEEQRKLITAAFRTGDDLFIFDEAHELSGNTLARALTASVYSDRILGLSRVGKFPNLATWVSLGNNVRIEGDVTRRVYRIRLEPQVENPQDRGPECFRHPNLQEWTRENRGELITAALTLIRAWFAGGQPPSMAGARFGSFETWGRMVGGILELAGQRDFLGNLMAWRSESDFESKWWLEHLSWLHQTFGETAFTAADVKREAMQQASLYPAPPGIDGKPVDDQYARKLGVRYHKVAGRSYQGYRLVKLGLASGHVQLYSIEHRGRGGSGGPGPQSPPTPPPVTPPEVPGSDPGGQEAGGTGGTGRLLSDTDRSPTPGEWGTGGTPTPSYIGKITSLHTRHTHVISRIGEGRDVPQIPQLPFSGDKPVAESSSDPVVFDLETAGRAELFSYGPGYVRLAGYTVDGDIHLSTDIDAVAKLLTHSPRIIGHNILGFDLLALARYHGIDIHELVERGAVFDTLLAARYIDPPMAREKGVDAKRKYDLDTLGEKFGLGPKSTALKTLAEEFGGYDRIPVDDERYREYLRRDVYLSAGLFARLDSDEPYLVREHRVAALGAQISLNGFRLDLDLLAARLAEGERRRTEALTELNERYDIPLTNEKGTPFKSPLASKPGKEALEAAFRRLGVDKLPTTEKSGQLMTSGDAMAVLKHLYATSPEIVRLCELVATVTTERTIYQTIEANRVGDRVHPTVSMEQATGRWSITRPGLTVLGKRGGRYREREVFLPEEGHVIVSVDFAQIDARAIAALSEDPAYAQLFAPGVDAHAEVARRIWGDEKRRDDAKAIGHGWNYGMGLRKLSETAGVPFHVAEQFDQAMRVQFPKLVAWREEIRQVAGSGQLLDNGFGRLMRPDPERAHTQGPALMGQGAARDIAMEGLLRLPREVYPYLRAFVHDEVVLSVPADIATDVERAVLDALTFEWRGVPILAEPQTHTVDGRKVPAHGFNWGEIYRKDAA